TLQAKAEEANKTAKTKPALSRKVTTDSKPGYQQVKALADAAWERNKQAAAALDKFPKGPMGLTPDSVKATPEWQTAKKEADQAFAATRAANTFLLKNFPKEVRADRDAERAAKAKPAFSRSKTPAPKPQSRARVESVINSIKAKWKNAPEVVVIDSITDAPADVQEENNRQLSMGASGEPEGFISGNKVYIVASQMKTPGDVMRVLLHESLGHFGLRGVFGAELQTVLRQVAAMRPRDMETKAQQYGLDLSNEEDRLTAAEEILAEMAQTNPQSGIVRRAIAAIHKWLRTHIPGFQNLQLSDSEIIQDILIPAKRFVENGSKRNSDGKIAFKRVFHGTPHIWPPEPGFPHGRPRLDKMGSGEGAQAYGWGWYSAESSDVARGYQVALTSSDRVKQLKVAATYASSKWFKSGMTVNGKKYY
ncbi:MAG TPA: hypothetical protein VF243_01425, partial [Nitrosospira sp.]